RSADTAKCGIGIERVGYYAVVDGAVLAVHQIVEDDQIVVIGDMGEGRAAFNIAKHPDSGDIGLELAVVLDVSVLVGGNACLVETEVVRIGHLTDRHEKMRALNPLGRSILRLDGDLQPIGRLWELGALSGAVRV